MKTRQEQEALEEFIEKQRRLEDYKLRCIKDEEREENRKELHRLIGPFDPINIAADGGIVGSGHLVKRNNGSQVLFSDERGRRKSKGDTSKTPSTTECGNHSKSAEDQVQARRRSKSGERSSSLETKSKPLSTLSSQNSKKQGGSGESLTNANKRPVAAPRNVGKLSNTTQSGSKERLPNSRHGSRESLKSSTDPNQLGSKEKLNEGTKQSRQGRDRINRNASKVKPEWNSSEKMEYAKLSKSEIPARSRSAEGKSKKLVAAPRSSSLENEKKSDEGGDDRRGSVASLYVYRGSVSSECDVPLAYSRSRSKFDDEENVCEDDLIQSLMNTDEGRSALTEGRPLSREGRRRLQDNTRGEGVGGNNNQERTSSLMTKPTKKMANKQGSGNGEKLKTTGTMEPLPEGRTTDSAKGSSNQGSSNQGSSDQGSISRNKDQTVQPGQGTQQAKGSATAPNKNQQPTAKSAPQGVQQHQGAKKRLIEEDLMAIQESVMENSPAMNFDDDDDGKQIAQKKSTSSSAPNSKGLLLSIFYF